MLLKDWHETNNALGQTITTTQTIDVEDGNVFTGKTTGACTWTFSNPIETDDATSFTLLLTDGDVGTQTWPTSVDWAGGTAPTLGSAVDILVFITNDGGTIWHGMLASAASA